MVPKRAVTTNAFVGAARVISHPYKWLLQTTLDGEMTKLKVVDLEKL
jgi:hypothetical protein